MNIDKVNQGFLLDTLWIYNNKMLYPFINHYLKSTKKCKYQLFNGYIFQYSRLEQSFIKHFLDNDQIYLTKDKKHLDLRYGYVKKYFIQDNMTYFIGYTAKNQPLFLHLHKSKHNYYYSGYMIDISDKNLEYSYLVDDCKFISKLENLPIHGIQKYELNQGKQEYSPIYQLLEQF